MNALSFTLPAVAVVLASSPTTVVQPGALKCGTTTKPLIAVDGRIAEVTVEEVDRDRLFWIEIVCMDPVDSTFSMDPGLPVISLWTVDGPAPAMEGALAEILELQASYRSAHGAYALTLEELSYSSSAPGVEVSLDATSGGWMAVATVHNFLTKCVVFDGSREPPHWTVSAGEPTYLSRHEVSAAELDRR